MCFTKGTRSRYDEHAERLLSDRRRIRANGGATFTPKTAMDHAAWWLRTLLPVSPFSSLPTRRLPDATPIVVIGCDSGMGRRLVDELVALRTPKVYAGCLTEAGVAEVGALRNVVAFRVDVTQRNQMEAAYETIASQEPAGVFAIVHIAGAMKGGPVEWTSRDVFKWEMDLNFFGLLNTIQCGAPLLKKHGKRSRLIAITSTIAIMPSFPGLSGYVSFFAQRTPLLERTDARHHARMHAHA